MSAYKSDFLHVLASGNFHHEAPSPRRRHAGAAS